MGRVFIIAEAGVNHNGDAGIAKKMVDIARDCGCDAIKFQTYNAENVISVSAPKAEYQRTNTELPESQLAMAQKYQLDMDIHRDIIDYCRKRQIAFLSSPFDLDSIDMLAGLGIEVFKIPSGEITNLPYLRKLGALKKEIIISSGAADISEIKAALDILTASGTPKEKITLLHCNTAYPTPVKDANLLAIKTLREVFGVKVGYSDHTLCIETAVAAVALEAAIIEKHFTLNRSMEGPDHKASLEPDELKAMVSAVRNIEKALGDGVKRPSASELKNKDIVRKSIVAKRDIRKSEVLGEYNLAVKRPGYGINPMDWDSVIGKKAKKNFKADEMIEL